MNEIKTMAGWQAFQNPNGRTDWDDYCHPGDQVDEEVFNHFLNILPPRTMRTGYFQVGEPVDHRKDPKTGKYKATWATFIENGNGQYFYLGNCFAGEREDVNLWIDHKTVRRFLAITAHPGSDGFQKSRPHILCADGFKLSVQAGDQFYSIPRKDLEDCDYTHVEVGPLGEYEEMFFPYAEDPRKPKSSVNARVPVELVDALIQKHGGFFESRAPYVAAWEEKH